MGVVVLLRLKKGLCDVEEGMTRKRPQREKFFIHIPLHLLSSLSHFFDFLHDQHVPLY
jgi:hypothetical protein